MEFMPPIGFDDVCICPIALGLDGRLICKEPIFKLLPRKLLPFLQGRLDLWTGEPDTEAGLRSVLLGFESVSGIISRLDLVDTHSIAGTLSPLFSNLEGLFFGVNFVGLELQMMGSTARRTQEMVCVGLIDSVRPFWILERWIGPSSGVGSCFENSLRSSLRVSSWLHLVARSDGCKS